ncbi:MAG: CpsD/CapB family tyrosine-protein kinase [Elusimicrobia bacterium]|nr:CpsD/CapB family tyrosine-protein kinase [Elusimicrobiota bacterium]
MENDKIHLGKSRTAAVEEKIIVPTISSGIDKSILTYFQPKGAIAEQYRALRTNLKRINKDNPVKTIVLTSSVHNEGKSTTSVNLAVAMSYEKDRKVLLIDGDLRKSKTHLLLGMINTKGLSELLNSKATVEEVIRYTPIPGLDIITSGAVPSDPSELLESRKMKDLLSAMKLQYDFIIIDTPPIIPLTDAAALGINVDGVVMVVQTNRTKKEVVTQAENLLQQAGCNLLGFILTNVEYYIPSYYYKYV